MSTILKGIAASSGIAIGKAYLLVQPDLSFKKIAISDAEEEIHRLHSALNAAKSDLEFIRQQTIKLIGEDEAAIFDAHLLVVSDPELLTAITEKISNDKVSAERALTETTNHFVRVFEQLENQYMKERAADITDVSKRILSHLLGVKIPNPGLVAEDVVIVAEDLTPADTAQLNKEFVKGFVTNIGSRTSYSTMMARSIEIPAVVGTKEASTSIKQGDFIIVDGFNGDVHINPTPEIVQQYEDAQQSSDKKKTERVLLKNSNTQTNDGRRVELAAMDME
ncbi:hypothetical protein J8TS2_18000 [Lederbergia ruris]|uniref:Phosphoenolpyruvate-protein phosphotransferase n=1 Tax=Lederbergia ruris TaxID=217495 RepID=A0ABQ4KJ50_9BACI|nr:phosphoenolpyruvate-utilizing N-terminal domain-containing protein [Lederbergia ruris]GIN57481.1 hypothetical protein J8TS2_18000 [Lederbergia ruris]